MMNEEEKEGWTCRAVERRAGCRALHEAVLESKDVVVGWVVGHGQEGQGVAAVAEADVDGAVGCAISGVVAEAGVVKHRARPVVGVDVPPSGDVDVVRV